jgi:hypothetical protein
MKHILLIAVLGILALPARATAYFLSPTGNDSNNGLSSGAAWLTPNHAVNCGDVITAAASVSYSPSSFGVGSWGTVTCPGNNNVAWVACAAFDACKMTSPGGAASGFYVDHSYWGVQGFEVTITADTFAGCFLAAPSFVTHTSIHHVIFANNIANGCYAGGIGAGASGTGSVDYIAIVGNAVYDGAKTTSDCPSNIDIFEPQNVLDTLPGTHIYVAGNFSFKAMNTANCNGGNPASDGEGINIDSMNKAGGTSYSGQVVIENNMVLANGGRGIEEEQNSVGSPNAIAFFRRNTMWGDSIDSTQTGNPCAEFQVTSAFNLVAFANIAQPTVSTSCGSMPVYAYQVTNSATATDNIYSTWGFSAFSNNSNVTNSAGFSFGPNNTFGTDPQFANPSAPSAPNCGAASSVTNCMAQIIANFTPTNAAAKSYGYQIPSSSPVFDPLFPQWLCTVTNFPAGLVTMGCLTATSAISGNVTLNGGVTIH